MKRVVATCDPQCSLGVGLIGQETFDTVHGWYEKGTSAYGVWKQLPQVGLQISKSSVFRHFKKDVSFSDPVEEAQEAALESFENPEARLSDLEILERIIQKGAASLFRKDTKVTPEMTMKALDLKLKLTQGSVFDSFLGAVADAMSDSTPEDEVDPDA